MQQTPQDACCQQLSAQAGWPSSLLPDGGFARLLDRLHQQGFHQRGWGLDHWQIPLSRGIIRHREVSFFSFKDSFEKDCPLFFPFWQPLSGISWSRWDEPRPYIIPNLARKVCRQRQVVWCDQQDLPEQSIPTRRVKFGADMADWDCCSNLPRC